MREKPIYLTPEDIATQLQVNIHTVYRWIKSGRLPAIRFERTYRIDPDDFKKFLAERKK